MKWKPTAEEVLLIKRAGVMECSPFRNSLKAIVLEPGIKFNTDDENVKPHMNELLVSEDDDAIDLWDKGPDGWSDFRKGVELTEDGRAVVDFYIYKRCPPNGADEGLGGNVTVYYSEGRITRIQGYGGGPDNDLLPALMK